LGRAAVYEQFGTVDEARIVGRQEQHRLGDFFRLGHAAERYGGGQVIDQPLPLGGVLSGQVQQTGIAILDPQLDDLTSLTSFTMTNQF
jgi:hypothetical protein